MERIQEWRGNFPRDTLVLRMAGLAHRFASRVFADPDLSEAYGRWMAEVEEGRGGTAARELLRCDAFRHGQGRFLGRPERGEFALFLEHPAFHCLAAFSWGVSTGVEGFMVAHFSGDIYAALRWLSAFDRLGREQPRLAEQHLAVSRPPTAELN
ncbi:MAG: hypothetical protein ACOCV4_07025 [Myxococcota bacterium]